MRAGHVLVIEGHDSTKAESYYRAIGGGIEFGETAEAALRREFREELDVTLGNVTLLGVIENIFEYEGHPGHEIAHVFALDSDDFKALPDDADLRVLDEGSTVRWVPLDAAHAPLYPAGVRDLLTDRGLG